MNDYAVFHQCGEGFTRLGIVVDCKAGAEAIKKAKKRFTLIPHPAVQQLDAAGRLMFPADPLPAAQ